MAEQFVTIDKIKWWVQSPANGKRIAQPICPKHHLRLRPIKDAHSKYSVNYRPYFAYDLEKSRTLKCEDCAEHYSIPRNYNDEKIYIFDKVDSKTFKTYKFINIDDESIPIAEDKISTHDKYFVVSRLMDSKTGLRLVVYAGEKGKKQKAEIFVEPDIKRLSFDQNDIHPTEIFTKLEATFLDGIKSNLEKKPRK